MYVAVTSGIFLVMCFVSFMKVQEKNEKREEENKKIEKIFEEIVDNKTVFFGSDSTEKV